MKLPLVNAPGRFALVDDDYDGEWLSCYTWILSPLGYVALNHNPDKKKVYLHRKAYGEDGTSRFLGSAVPVA